MVSYLRPRSSSSPACSASSYSALGDVPLLGHRLQHVVAALHRPLGVQERVVLGGRLRQPGDQRRLGQVELRDRLREVGLGGGLDADRGPTVRGPVGGRVQVLGEDLRLRVLPLVLLRPGRLADLPLDRLLGVGDVEVADQLLRDRRASLDRGAGLQVLPARAHDRPVVDPAVLVEVLVLDRHRGVLEHPGDLFGGHRVPDRVRLDVAQALAVGGEHHRVAARLDRLQLVERWRVGPDAQHPDPDPHHGDGDRGNQDTECH